MEHLRPESEGSDQTPEADHGRDMRLVLSGVVAVLLAWFAIANLEDVNVHFWVVTTRAPVVAVVAISGVCGALIAFLAARFGRKA